VRLILDEMYPRGLANALRAIGIDAATTVDVGLAGRSDAELFDHAVANQCVLLTENVADYARLCADQLSAGRHHAGVLIALSSRFSRRPSGIPALVAAVAAVMDETLDDRLVYLAPVLR
jgi:uncharacterized protein DUF5615